MAIKIFGRKALAFVHETKIRAEMHCKSTLMIIRDVPKYHKLVWLLRFGKFFMNCRGPNSAVNMSLLWV